VPEVRLEPTPDVLAELSDALEGRVVVGFAAETTDLEPAGRAKLEAKGLDLIVVNEVGRPGTGFGSDTNDAMILSADGDDAPLSTRTKRSLAREICDRLVKLLERR
jgi:phosphopantothenoylcysteine decarboxylase/phosphopantothenate--cysteine ligase